jgi:peptidyl-prolyl cis-trans isomerase SurA
MLSPLLLAAALAAPAPAAPEGRVLDRVAATVNGDVVTVLELEDRIGPELQRIDAQPPGPARDRARARALKAAFDGLVAERLFDAQAAALGVEVTDQEIDAAVEEIKRRNNLDDARLEQALTAQGLDRTSFRKSVRRDLETARLVNVKVRSRLKVTDEDVKNYWQTHPQEFRSGEEIHVRHIFLALPQAASPAETTRVRGLADTLVKRLRGGEDFALVAKAASQGPSAADGGDLGWLRRGTVQPELEKVAFALQAGQISDVIRTRSGLQILKVEGRRGGTQRPLDEVKDEIRDRLMNEQAETYRGQFVAELRKDAVIEVKLPELKDQGG